jgi:hypothetical protein
VATPELAFPADLTTQVGGGRVITSPFQFVADADTFFRVTSVCAVSGVTIAIQGRRLDEKGRIQPIVETHAPASNRATRTQDFGLGVGAVLNLTVFASAGAPLIGQCYIMVQLLRNVGSAAIVLGTLLGGYVTAVQALGFPGSPIQSSTAGEPVVRNIIGTQPAAGASISEACPTNARWELITVEYQFVADGVAGTRRLVLQLRSGGTLFGSLPASNTLAAGGVGNFLHAQNIPVLVDITAGNYVGELPQRCFLRAADVFIVTGVGIDAGDQFFGPWYQVREWLEVG